MERNDARKPMKTSIREQLASLETSIARVYAGSLKRPRLAFQEEEPSSKKNRGDGEIATPPSKETKDLAEDLAGLGRDSEAGLFIQSPSEGPYEPLVLWPDEEGSSEVSERVEVPASINSRLLEHQREGVRFLFKLYREKRGGVLGDDMGLGKTIQSIAFIAAILHKDGELFQPSFKVKHQSRLKSCSQRESRKVVLILCPTSVIENWQREFEAWGSFSVGIFHGAHRDLIVAKVARSELDVVLTSHDTFRLHGSCLLEIEWDCVIVDEAHRLKNEKSQLYKACCQLRTKARFGLTGTIMQNKLLDLFNVFEWAAPGCLGTREYFKAHYDEPIKQGQKISASAVMIELAEERRQRLLRTLRKYSLRRTKEETIGHLLRGKEDMVAFCAMSPVQRRVYTRLLESPDFQCLVRKDEPCSCGSGKVSAKCCLRTAPKGIIWSYLHRDNPDGCEACPYCLVLPCLTKLQQVSNHLELLKPNINDDAEKQARDKAFASLVFGEDAPSLGGIQPDESFLGLSDAQHCGKMLALKNLLSKWTSAGDKVLLFSYSVRMLAILEKFLIRRGYCFCRLDGSTPMNARQAIVDDFSNSPSKQVFLISTRAGGLGLNLVSANRVVVFDPNWNPAQDLQAQDRSFRFGQKRHVTVFRLLAAGSLEELIYTRQIYKQQLFNIAVTGTHEKRYFEGVQDSKGDKGELFGVSNLFRDLKDKVFTSEVIEQHKARLMRINVDDENECPKVRKGKARESKHEQDDDEHGLSDLAQLVKEKMQSPEDGPSRTKERGEIDSLLADAGVVYAHRNEEVVNIGVRANEAVAPEDLTTEECAPLKPARSGFVRVHEAAAPEDLTAKACAPQKPARPKAGGAILVGCTRSVKPKPGTKSVEHRKETNKRREAENENKKQLFSDLAKFKGLSVKEFSQWMVSASQEERKELLAKYRDSVKNN